MDIAARRDDWPERLSETAAGYLGRRFGWGTADCGTFFADCCAAMTGRDPLADIRSWSSPETALRRLASAGFGSVAELVRVRFTMVDPATAGRGDLIYLDGVADRLSSPAVIVGAEAMSIAEAGVVLVPRSLARWAFRV